MSSTGQEAVDLAEMAGLSLDEWQQLTLVDAMGERADGRWAAMEVGEVVPRQNGKGGVLEARELAGLVLLGEMVIHSAHQFDTSLEAFGRLLALIEDTPELKKMVRRVSKAAGQEGIEMRDIYGRKTRIRFRTRTKSGGRGFSADCVILDEAMIVSQAMHGALMPTLSAKPNPQIWYTGSAVDEDVHPDGVVFAKVRERGIAQDPNLAFFEWSCEDATEPTNPEMWARANPALGIRISHEYVATEQRSMDSRTFATERLGVGHWPDTSEDAGRVISAAQWAACVDVRSCVASRPVFAVDVTPDRLRASVAVSGAREDGLWHVEVVDNRDGVEWIVPRCLEIKKRQVGARFVIDRGSAAAALIQEFKNNRLRVVEASATDYTRGCGQFFDAVVEGRLRCGPQPELEQAVASASTRNLGDAWAWDRRGGADISPLVACTLALWGAQSKKTVRMISLSAV